MFLRSGEVVSGSGEEPERRVRETQSSQIPTGRTDAVRSATATPSRTTKGVVVMVINIRTSKLFGGSASMLSSSLARLFKDSNIVSSNAIDRVPTGAAVS